MKILIFSHEFFPDVGGAGVVAEQYATFLSNIGNQVTVLTKAANCFDMNFTFRIVRRRKFPLLWFLSYFKSLNFNDYDLILLNDQNATFFAGLFFSDELLQKCKCFFHGSEPEDIFIKPSVPRKIINYKKFFHRALLLCDEIIAVSNFMKEKFITLADAPYLRDKIRIIYAGLDLKLFYPDFTINIRAKFGIPEDSLILLSVSRIEEKKGYANMLKIFEYLIHHGINVFWIIVGDGPFLKELKTLISEKNLGNKIALVGHLRRDELRYFYSSADYFWLLSEYMEAFGLVYLEAQACGTPAIAYDSAGVREAILDGGTGLLLSPETSRENMLGLLKSEKRKDFSKELLIAYSKRFDIYESCYLLLNEVKNNVRDNIYTSFV